MIKLASTLDAKERNSRDVQPFETAEEDGGNGDDGKPAPAEKFVDMENAKQYAENEYVGTKSDGEREKEDVDDMFDRVFLRTLGEEGKYEDRKDKIDAPTNMGIGNIIINIHFYSY